MRCLICPKKLRSCLLKWSWMLFSMGVWSTNGHATAAQKFSGDVACGPRCLDFLIRYYKKPEIDLVDLIQEVQWPDFEAGAKLSERETALNHRGIFTKCVRINSSQRLRWPRPVLAHLSEEGIPGHYVIWLPSSDSKTTKLWAGLSGRKSGPTADFAQKLSGVVMLTSESRIEDDMMVATSPRWMLMVGIIISVPLMVILLFIRFKRPYKPLADREHAFG